MQEIQKYHLFKDDYSKLHFDINDAKTYVDKNIDRATKPHRHTFFQVIWFKKAGNHYVDYEIVNHKENTVIFISKNQVHHFCENASNEGVLFHFNENFINVHEPLLMDRFLATVFNEVGANHFQLSKENIKSIGRFTEDIFKEISLKKQQYEDFVYHHFNTILLTIERVLIQNKNEIKHKDNYLSLAIKFKKAVKENITTFLNIQEYATLLNTNSSKLTTASKTHLLDTPANIIKALKILEAKRMLSNQNTSIKEIAYGLGFEEASYFTKYFKKETGLKPKEFQQIHL